MLVKMGCLFADNIDDRCDNLPNNVIVRNIRSYVRVWVQCCCRPISRDISQILDETNHRSAFPIDPLGESGM
jgi:hypothetical protein